jgi:predicted RNA binding protein YcfA (HicA-like mRNA interferase family)
MTEILASRILNVLLKKGFVADRSHHTMLWFAYKGKKTPVHTWFSHGRKKVDDGLLRLMARELGLSFKEFLDLVECRLSQEGYAALLIERGHLRGS